MFKSSLFLLLLLWNTSFLLAQSEDIYSEERQPYFSYTTPRMQRAMGEEQLPPEPSRTPTSLPVQEDFSLFLLLFGIAFFLFRKSKLQDRQ